METELFVHFAEIAGVFVGFGALISLRSAHLTDVHDIVYLQAVLGLGIWVVVSALTPIVISRYDVSGHPLWLSSAAAALTVWLVMLVSLWVSTDWREFDKHQELADKFFAVVGLPLHVVIAGSLLLVLIGVWRRVDEALYVTALAAGVAFAGYTLLVCVMSQKHGHGTHGD